MHFNKGWKGTYARQAEERKAKRKSKRNRAYKRLRKLDKKGLLEPIDKPTLSIKVIEEQVEDKKPDFLKNLNLAKKEE